MCIAIPAKVIDIDESLEIATVKVANQEHRLKIMLSERLQVGDWVLSYGQAAIAKLDEFAAQETLRLLSSLTSQGPKENNEQDFHTR